MGKGQRWWGMRRPLTLSDENMGHTALDRLSLSLQYRRIWRGILKDALRGWVLLVGWIVGNIVVWDGFGNAGARRKGSGNHAMRWGDRDSDGAGSGKKCRPVFSLLCHIPPGN